MSEATARAKRRDLRRAFGPEAASLIESQDEQLQILTRTATALVAIMRRGLWGRLRWLVTGK